MKYAERTILATKQPIPVASKLRPKKEEVPTGCPDVSSNDEIERRAGALIANEADLSQSSTPSLGSPKTRSPRSLEPIVSGQPL